MLDFNPGEHICVVGDARPEKTNPIYLAHEKVILILVVERATGLIVDADTNMVCELTRRFLRSVFVGHSLVDDLEEIRNSLLDNYLGDSKRVLYAAARTARMTSRGKRQRFSQLPPYSSVRRLVTGERNWGMR